MRYREALGISATVDESQPTPVSHLDDDNSDKDDKDDNADNDDNDDEEDNDDNNEDGDGKSD